LKFKEGRGQMARKEKKRKEKKRKEKKNKFSPVVNSRPNSILVG
jgi:hypothetical protein